MYSCTITAKISINQAVNMVGNAMQRNLVERVLVSAPERAILDRAGLSTVIANTKKGGVSSIQKKKKYYLFTSNHLEKKPQVGILKAYMSQKGQKPISDLLKAPS